ncbi:MAG: GNAT family N-acetyltransferase [archaeon]|jgi:ribosomal-protein-alanine N-acetyltransferase
MTTKKKVSLREATIDDSEFVYALTKDKDYQKYFPSNLIATDLEDQKRKLRHFVAQMQNQNGYYFIILFGKEKAGILDLYKIDRKNNRAAIGYGIDKKYWGKGIATTALKEAMKYSKEKQKLHALAAYIHPKNIASQKVMKKCKFKKVGTLKDYDFEKGKYEDQVLYWKILK